MPDLARGQEPLVALAQALRCRAIEIAEASVQEWHAAGDPFRRFDGTLAEPRLFSVIDRATQKFIVEGTEAVAQMIVTNEPPPAEHGRLAWAGRTTIDAEMALSEVIRVHLIAARRTISIQRAEARRLGLDEVSSNHAYLRTTGYFQWSLVVIAEQFDVRRSELQVQLAAEQAQLAEEQARLAHEAVHDPMTGLPNRVFFLERLAQVISSTNRRAIRAAVLFVDIDRFKTINDVAGHAAGDQLIVGVAQRLRETLRPSDTVARLGGDEFVILCENLFDAQTEAIGIAERISQVLAKPFVVANSELFTSVSIGVAFVKAGDDPYEVVEKADSAMYMAKQNGRARHELYHPDFNARTTRRAELINGLHRAIENEELTLHYQPVKTLASGAVVAMEALCRWQHPSLGTIAPTEFIPLAEETGLIVDIGRWVLVEACDQCRRWQEEGFAGVGVSVNVSGRQLAEPTFAHWVADALRAIGLSPTALTMEVTESVLVTEGSTGHGVLDELQKIGIRLAIDDFGVGYSSLSYLAKLPIHTLKVDRSFIAGLGSPGQDASIVVAMVELAHKLGLAVVAEGVETEAELAVLRGANCDEAQGYLLGRPATFLDLRGDGALATPT
jgi:diguanylate cyclase (GGDEF)-like protein